MGTTFSACGPFCPLTSVKLTACPSARVLKPWPTMERKCTNKSAPLGRWMKPKPLLSLNHLTVPVCCCDINVLLNSIKCVKHIQRSRTDHQKTAGYCVRVGS